MLRPKTNLRLINLILPVTFTLCVLLAPGCKKGTKTSGEDTGPTVTPSLKIDSTTITSGTAEGSKETGANTDDQVEGSTFGSVVTIAFGTTVNITNAVSGVTIVQSGANLVITSKVDGVEYKVSGTTTNGSVKIYSDKKFKLTLNGANITSTSGPAINIQSKKRCFVVLADGSTNTLTDSPTYPTSTEDMKGTFFSEAQLVFSGTGSLTVQGNYKHAICSDDYVHIRTGTITVTGAVKDGIHSNSGFIADGGTVKITANTGDAIECEEGSMIINDGKFTLASNEKGINASYEGTDATITPYININGGTLNINVGTGEGISTKLSAITINGGNIAITSSDDCLNAAKAININSGFLYLYSKLNDGMDSNGTITITGGKTVAIGTTATEAGLDCNTNVMKLTGGVVVGIGSETSGPSATASTINSLVMGSGTANQLVHIEAADGTDAMTFLAPLNYTTMLYACAKVKSATAYTVYTGGSVAAGTNFRGLYTSGNYTKGDKKSIFTTSGVVTQTGGTVSTK
ncbi:carbohydrate-binding domain-containing protein [Mucilaginibacter mali]|uniref:Carbohydrate-binding domain-containing protein n=1 Tax=Mucilaginibacter mali TaxID=2740462 RepID=A0A7D4Q4S1_9SPHI|nr:carbohydrate-binding domain-containing protein [Mucilaginibacter mali]QKJ31227.1 carbohydrate-binding domain-containing protein [Mucilaginibacter mali]